MTSTRPHGLTSSRTNGSEDTMSGPGDLAIETAGLMKSFGANRAVDGIDLAVPTGTVYGLLGPNGAGKTTAVKMLATLLRPDGGQARVFGHDVVHEAAAVRARVSLTGQYASEIGRASRRYAGSNTVYNEDIDGKAE